MGLYIHFPWCVKKCPYCDFNSHAMPQNMQSAAYIKALIVDFERDHAYAHHPKIHTIFLGGGTPSLFSADEMKPLFDIILPHCAPNVEITLEANPGTIEHGQFSDYRALGINRISLGVQSFHHAHLNTLGRIHDCDHILKAIDEIKAAGFDNFNIDIMHGLPNQTVSEALSDLEQAISYGPTHLSWYQLTIEPNTYFATHPPILPDEDTLFAIEAQGLACLEANGYKRYEISAFAKDGYRAQHNLNYWNFGDYIGIGAGAHGKITHSLPNGIVRTTKPKVPKSYLHNFDHSVIGRAEPKHPVSREDVIGEYMMNALRLVDGFSLEGFTQTTGLPNFAIADQVSKLVQRGLLCEVMSPVRMIKTTVQGQRFLNDVLLEF